MEEAHNTSRDACGRANSPATRRKSKNPRSDYVESECCVCFDKLPRGGGLVLNLSLLLKDVDGNLPGTFVCSEACRVFFKGEDKRRRAPQVKRIAQLRSCLLGTKVCVGDEVWTRGDTSAGTYVEEGLGRVISLRYIEAQRCAKIGVAQIIGGTVVHVWPDSVAAADEENQVPKVKRLRRGAKSKPLQVLYGEQQFKVGQQRAVAAEKMAAELLRLKTEADAEAEAAKTRSDADSSHFPASPTNCLNLFFPRFHKICFHYFLISLSGDYLKNRGPSRSRDDGTPRTA